MLFNVSALHAMTQNETVNLDIWFAMFYWVEAKLHCGPKKIAETLER